jgi:hypothetical protein
MRMKEEQIREQLRVGDVHIREQIEKSILRRLGAKWIVIAISRYELPRQMTVWSAIAQCGDQMEHSLFMADFCDAIVGFEATYQIEKMVEAETERSQLI